MPADRSFPEDMMRFGLAFQRNHYMPVNWILCWF